MTPEVEFGEIRYPVLLQQLAAGDPRVAILLADDWNPMDTYRPSEDFHFVKYASDGAYVGHLTVASRGWHPNSYWYARDGRPLAITPYAWKPIDWSGHPSWRAYLDVLWPPAPPWVRPPEEVCEPTGTDQRLTPAPRKMLEAMRDGAALREHVWNWTTYKMTTAGVTSKLRWPSMGQLVRCAFIERIGTLPPGHPRKIMVFDWVITPAGHAWLAANDGLAARERRRARAAQV
jgi:hypothetical protein